MVGVAHAEGDVIFKGGKTGQNFYGTIGRQVASVEGFKYGAPIAALGESGIVWVEELLDGYIKDPKGFLKEQMDDGKAKPKMTFKWKQPENVIADLVSVAPAMGMERGMPADDAAATGDTPTSEGDSAASN